MTKSEVTYDYEMLQRALKDEAASLRERAKKISDQAAWLETARKAGNLSPESFGFVAQNTLGAVTHRSNIHLETIVRTATACAAHAAALSVKEAQV